MQTLPHPRRPRWSAPILIPTNNWGAVMRGRRRLPQVAAVGLCCLQWCGPSLHGAPDAGRSGQLLQCFCRAVILTSPQPLLALLRLGPSPQQRKGHPLDRPRLSPIRRRRRGVCQQKATKRRSTPSALSAVKTARRRSPLPPATSSSAIVTLRHWHPHHHYQHRRPSTQLTTLAHLSGELWTAVQQRR